jgi:type IV secretory pathway VirB2 component (pilin)
MERFGRSFRQDGEVSPEGMIEGTRMSVALSGQSIMREAVPAALFTEPAIRRSRRVILLVIGITLLSIVDLLITLAHLQSIGMMEANPIAAFLIKATNSALALTVYKFVTVGFCVAVLYKLRRMRSGEVAAWVSVIICAWMCIAWHRYTTNFDDLDALVLAHTGAFGENWLVIE